jgi:hypothetical protein
MVLVCNAPERADALLRGLEASAFVVDAASGARLAALPRAPAPGSFDLAEDPWYQSSLELVRSLPA